MTPRFDEVELRKDPLNEADPPKELVSRTLQESGRLRRFMTAAIDLSIFAALLLALSPLLTFGESLADTIAGQWMPMLGMFLFVLMLSYFYFAGSWLLWGKTVGATILETKVVGQTSGKVSLRAASLRWVGVFLSILTAGLGFLLAAFPGARSLPDRLSNTRVAIDRGSTGDQRDGNH